MSVFRALAVGGAVLVLAACAGEDEEAPGLWQGPPRASEDGTVPVDGFNGLIEARDPDWARTPVLAAAAFLGEEDRTTNEGPDVSVVQERPREQEERTVVVTEDNLPDDSVRAARYVLVFRRGEEGRWLLASARWSQRCRPDRGHQDFEPAPCS